MLKGKLKRKLKKVKGGEKQKMVKVNVYNIPKKDFEKQFGKYAYGASSLEYGEPDIILKGSVKSKKLIKGTVEHELGHIFSETRKITRKLPIKEKKLLLKMARGNMGYKERKAISGKEIMQEQIADLYGYSKSKNGTRKALQEAFPKTMSIIKEERKKFKPKLVKRKWE